MRFTPPQARTDVTRIVIYGRREALVEGCEGIDAYDEHRLCLRAREGLIILSGEELRVDSFGERDLWARGKIVRLEWEERP